MTANGYDPLVDALGRLGTDPPGDLLDRLFGNWVRIAGPIEDLYVAFTDQGVSYIRTASSVHGDDEEFQEAYRQAFGKPLRRAERPPTGLLPALRHHHAARSVRVDLRHLTDFERDVLEATRGIPWGQTRPYSWVAREISRPRAVRAVGTALSNNPVPVLIPCHRVVRANGQLGDYAFGSKVKEELLRAEGANVDEALELARNNVFYLGSDRTHIVCFPTCMHARRISVAHRRGFRDIDTATRAGYRPCQHCRPSGRVVEDDAQNMPLP
jgi:methylated-DNA-[protein]-cysteine S-methyltransferase